MKRYLSIFCAFAALAFVSVSCNKNANPDTPAGPALEISELYVLGSACDTGWDLDIMTAFTKTADNVFEWEGHLKANDEFRFPLQKQSNVWWPCLVMGEKEGTLAIGKSDDEKNQIPVTKGGVWHITVNGNDATYKMELVLEDVKDPVNVEHLFMLGDACDTGWSLDDMTEFTSTVKGVFEWEGNLQTGKEFRFLIQNEPAIAWWPCFVMGEKEGTLVVGQGDDDKNQIPLSKSGVWHVKVDTRTYTYVMTFVK